MTSEALDLGLLVALFGLLVAEPMTSVALDLGLPVAEPIASGPQRGRPSMYGISARTKSLSSPSAASAKAASKASSAEPAMPSA